MIGRLRGRSDRQVVVLAHRDCGGPPGRGGRVEHRRAARARAGDGRARPAQDDRVRVRRRRVGGDGGRAALRRALRRPAEGRGGAGARRPRAPPMPQRPYVVPWSTGSSRASLAAARTVDAALARETGARRRIGVVARAVRPPGLAAHAARAGPAAARGHRRGHDHGPRASCRAAPARTRSAGISENRLTRFGRAAFASVLAFDSPGYRGKPPSRYLTAGRNVIPGWSLALFAARPDPAGRDHRGRRGRARRPARRCRSGRGCAGRSRPRCRSRSPCCGALAFELVGWLPDTVAEAVVAGHAAVVRRGGRAAARTRSPVRRRRGSSLRRLALGRRAPAPAARARARPRRSRCCCRSRCWSCARSTRSPRCCSSRPRTCACSPRCPRRPRRALLAAALVAGALALPVLAMLYYGARFDLGLSLHSYLLMVVSTAAGSVGERDPRVAGRRQPHVERAAGGRRRRAPRPPRRSRSAARVTYAGPGSLGGTESALRR